MDKNHPAFENPAEWYNQAVEAFYRGELAEAVSCLRAGFFGNFYVPPLLLGEESQIMSPWHFSPLAEPPAAEDYAARYRTLWLENPQALPFLRQVWSDPLVRNELKSYANLCKSLNQTGEPQRRQELLKERERFINPERIKRTQSEILQRLSKSSLNPPVERPFLGLVMFSTSNPAESLQFFRKVFGLEPVRTSEIAGGYAEFDLQGVRIAVHGYNQHGHGDPYRLGPPPKSFGWGAFFVIRVKDFDRYYQNALSAGFEILDSDLEMKGLRFFVVKDPSGYVFEITEEELRGLSGP